MQAEYFEGLSQGEEAALFLARNDRRAIQPFDRFRIRITAGEPGPCDIERIVNAAGLAIGRGGEGRSTSSPSPPLENVYSGGRINTKAGPAALAKTLKTIEGAWGRQTANFAGVVTEGIGLVHLRYGAQVNEEHLVARLAAIRWSGRIAGEGHACP